jgi:hypothetical protein
MILIGAESSSARQWTCCKVPNRLLRLRVDRARISTMKLLASYGLLTLAALLLAACEEPFSPKGPYLDRTVVFSLLAARSDTAFVRVYRTYYPPRDNPYEVDWETPDTSARVVLSDGTRSITLHDTVLTRADGSVVHAYAGYPFHIEPGGTYSLTVTGIGEEGLSSSTIVPGDGWVVIQDPETLSDLQSNQMKDIWVEISLSAEAAGWIPRLAVEFQVVSTGALHEEDVPLVLRTPDEQNKNPLYPDIMRTETAPRGSFVVTYSLHAYAYALRKIQEDHGEVHFSRAHASLIQTDQPLYMYYNIANGFRDSYSIRMDQRDYSNIQGGLGVFGAFNLDEKWYSLPASIYIPPTL